MVKIFKELSGDDKIIKQFDLKNPENILKETVESIKSTIEKSLEKSGMDG
jgi:hypothetical protein